MQPYPQDPSQNAYPRFEDGQQQPGFQPGPQPGFQPGPQPGAQPGFAVTHNNPYAQPGQPGQPMYIPPTQYGMPQPEFQPGYTVQPNQSDAVINQMQIRQIDDELASGWWACFNCWMYVVAIFSVLSIFGGIALITVYLPAIVMVVQSIVLVAFAVVMIDVLKTKKLDRAVLGLYIAFADGFMTVAAFAVQYFIPLPLNTGQQYMIIVQPTLGTLVFNLAIWGLIILLPAMKAKEHIERRESLISQSYNSFNA